MIDHVPPATAEMIERAIDANGLDRVACLLECEGL